MTVGAGNTKDDTSYKYKEDASTQEGYHSEYIHQMANKIQGSFFQGRLLMKYVEN